MIEQAIIRGVMCLLDALSDSFTNGEAMACYADDALRICVRALEKVERGECED